MTVSFAVGPVVKHECATEKSARLSQPILECFEYLTKSGRLLADHFLENPDSLALHTAAKTRYRRRPVVDCGDLPSHCISSIRTFAPSFSIDARVLALGNTVLADCKGVRRLGLDANRQQRDCQLSRFFWVARRSGIKRDTQMNKYQFISSVSQIALAVSLSMTAQTSWAQSIDDINAFDLGTLVLDARRRPESALDVPVSASVQNEDDIERSRSDDLEDLARNVAGFEQPNYGDDPRTAQPIIRGVGPLSTLLSPDNATTTIVVDGVPQPAFSASGQLLDIEQVDVLRGPQGTLFGRNSTAGAVVLRSRQPDGLTDGRLTLEVGTDGYRKLDFVGGTALSDTVSARLAFRLLDQDGYITNDHPNEIDLGGYDIGAAKLALRYAPTAQTDLTFTLGYEKDARDTGYPILLRDSNAFQETPFFERETASATINLRHEFDSFELHSVTSYSKYDILNTTDNTDGYLFGALFGGLPATTFTNDGEFNTADQTEKQFYQELRLQSLPNAPIGWVVGLAFSDNSYVENVSGNSAVFATVNGTRRVELDTRSAAVFGDISVPFGQGFEFGAGLRYTKETKDIDATFVGNGFAGTVASSDQQSSRDFEMLTGRLSLSYAPTESSLVYGSITRGAKAGGYPRFTNNASFGAPEPGYDQTDIWSFEIGGKTEILDGAGFVTGAVFYNDISDEAIFTFDPATNTFPVENMDTKTYGIEIETGIDLGRGFDLRAGATWTHAEITGTQAGTAFPGVIGNDVPNVPRLSTSITLGYEGEEGFAGLTDARLAGYLSWNHVGKRAVDVNNNFDLDAQNVVNARLSLIRGNTEFYVFGENLLDEPLEQQGSQIAPGVQSVVTSRGRTIGIGLTMRF